MAAALLLSSIDSVRVSSVHSPSFTGIVNLLDLTITCLDQKCLLFDVKSRPTVQYRCYSSDSTVWIEGMSLND